MTDVMIKGPDGKYYYISSEELKAFEVSEEDSKTIDAADLADRDAVQVAGRPVAYTELGFTIDEGFTVEKGFTTDQGVTAQEGFTTEKGFTIQKGFTIESAFTVTRGFTISKDE